MKIIKIIKIKIFNNKKQNKKYIIINKNKNEFLISKLKYLLYSNIFILLNYL